MSLLQKILLLASAGNVAALAELSRYASQFIGGTYHTRVGDSDTPIANASGEAVVASTTYVYKLPGTYEGYELMVNLDFDVASSYASGTINTNWTTGSGWEPIGDNSTSSDDSRFTAIFEGNGHTISNLFIERSSSYVGLFGYVSGGSAELRNLGMVDVEVMGDASVGGLVGGNGGGISNSYATGSVTGTGDNVGGLVGINFLSTVSNSYATGSVTGSVTESSKVGGLVGINILSTVSNSYATGAVTGSSDVGGLVGQHQGGSTITASYYNSETTGQDDDTGKGEPKDHCCNCRPLRAIRVFMRHGMTGQTVREAMRMIPMIGTLEPMCSTLY